VKSKYFIMTSLDLIATGTVLGHLPHIGLAAILGNYLIPVAGMVFALGVTLIRALEKAHRDKLRHETIQRALEKGQPLPSEFIEGKPLPPEFFAQFARKARDDRRGGLIAIAVGIGLYVFFGMMREEGVPEGMKWLGLIPALVGGALLINWALERRQKDGEPKP
jgi:hypothetical protein